MDWESDWGKRKILTVRDHAVTTTGGVNHVSPRVILGTRLDIYSQQSVHRSAIVPSQAWAKAGPTPNITGVSSDMTRFDGLSQIAPRAVLTNQAPGFILEINSLLKRPRVCSCNGQFCAFEAQPQLSWYRMSDAQDTHDGDNITLSQHIFKFLNTSSVDFLGGIYSVFSRQLLSSRHKPNPVGYRRRKTTRKTHQVEDQCNRTIKAPCSRTLATSARLCNRSYHIRRYRRLYPRDRKRYERFERHPNCRSRSVRGLGCSFWRGEGWTWRHVFVGRVCQYVAPVRELGREKTTYSATETTLDPETFGDVSFDFKSSS